MNKTLIITLAVVFLLGLVGCTSSVTVSNGKGNLPVPQPESGDTITITNCKANPAILQVNDGTEVTFVNSDSQDHVLFIENQEINVAAGGTAKFVATSSVGVQYTTNYLCDNQYSGAIFIV
ncbi:hypothetical protein HYU22_01900 [Candidatus Woesearchaeota archaeon]|nr:hypothetical protein [Candidatus Woesearchaeota archaeon]